MLNNLKGYRTYIVAALMGIATAAEYMRYITPDDYMAIMTMLGAGGIAAFRAGMKSG